MTLRKISHSDRQRKKEEIKREAYKINEAKRSLIDSLFRSSFPYATVHHFIRHIPRCGERAFLIRLYITRGEGESSLYHLPLFFLIKHNHDYNEWSRGNDMPQQTPRSWTNCSISSHCPVQNPFFSFEKGDKLCNIEQILHHMVALRI